MKRSQLFFISITALLLLLIGAYFTYTSYQQHQRAALVSSYTQTYKSFYLNGGSATIDQINQVLAEAQKAGTADDVARVQMLLANALFSRNQGDDRAQAATILKTIAADSKVGAPMRANAYLYLAAWLDRTSDEALMKRLVFNSAPYSNYLAQQGGNVSLATVQIFKEANKFQPSTFADYQMARLLALSLRSQGVNTKDTAQLAVATEARQDITQGDASLANAAKTLTAATDPAYFPYLYLVKSTALSVVQAYFADISTTTVAQSYEMAIVTAQMASTSPAARDHALSASLGYAAWLNSQQHNLQNTEIQSLLHKISTSNSPGFDQYIVNIQKRPAADYIRTQILQLAKLSPEFAKYLAKLGWKV